MSDLTEEQLRELRLQFYREPLGKMAVEAILKLKELGCDPLILHADVGRVVGYRSGNLGLLMRPRIQVIERRIKALRRHLREAAREANRLRGLWGFRGRMLDAGCFHATEELADIEKRFSKVNVKGYADWHPQREAILDLLDHVAKATGRYHYAEVSTIINAETAWRAFKRGEPMPEIRHEVDSLKMLVQRWRRDERKRLSEWKGKSDTPIIANSSPDKLEQQP